MAQGEQARRECGARRTGTAAGRVAAAAAGTRRPAKKSANGVGPAVALSVTAVEPSTSSMELQQKKSERLKKCWGCAQGPLGKPNRWCKVIGCLLKCTGCLKQPVAASRDPSAVMAVAGALASALSSRCTQHVSLGERRTCIHPPHTDPDRRPPNPRAGGLQHLHKSASTPEKLKDEPSVAVDIYTLRSTRPGSP